VRVFFCNFQDPLYVKLEKLEIMIRLADLKNVDSLLNELKDYAQEVDVQFVRRAISAIGRIAIKLDRAADRCIQVLHQLINTKIDYVVQEAVIVIKDIFRKYPNRYESIIRDLCENLKALDNVDARASMVWIVGEYGERIDNAVDLLTNFSQSFREEGRKVQLAILNAAVKLFLKVEGGAEELVQDVLRMATEESDNPDLRNRGYIYWKMLSSNPELAKQVVLCEKPVISEDASTLEPQTLDKLCANISMLSSVYYKVPDAFVKKIRDRINERLDLENEAQNGELQAKGDRE
jgi:AP-1 complex subunit beta-1